MKATIKDGQLIRTLYLRSLFPNILAVLGGTVNVLIDGILVGQKLGNAGLTAINQSMTVYLLLCTIGSLIAAGFSAKSAMALGANRPQDANRYYHTSLSFALIIGIGFCLAGLVLLEPLARLLSDGETYSFLKTYLAITLAGGVCKVLLYVPFFYLRLEGRNRQSAATMLLMMVLNVVLDYLFLFPLNAGIAGAAWASVLATATACLCGFFFLHRRNHELTPGLSFVSPAETASAARLGSPMALNNLICALRLFLLNLILGRLAAPGYAVTFAMLNTLNEFLLCVQNGVPQTATAMIGLFWGEKDFGALRNIFRVQVVTGCLLSGLLCVAVVAFYRQIPLLFGSDTVSLTAFVCYAAGLLPGIVNSVLFYYYSVCGKTELANLITVLRVLLLAVLPCRALCRTPLVWLFFPISELVTLLIVGGISLWYRRRGLSPWLLLDLQAEARQTTMSLEVQCDAASICGASEQVRDFCEAHDFPVKTAMSVSLAAEEILTIINEKSLEGVGSMDLRFMLSNNAAVLRIRAGGKPYNPMAAADDSLDYLGVRLIAGLAKDIDYQTTLGVNTLLIYL